DDDRVFRASVADESGAHVVGAGGNRTDRVATVRSGQGGEASAEDAHGGTSEGSAGFTRRDGAHDRPHLLGRAHLSSEDCAYEQDTTAFHGQPPAGERRITPRQRGRDESAGSATEPAAPRSTPLSACGHNKASIA